LRTGRRAVTPDSPSSPGSAMPDSSKRIPQRIFRQTSFRPIRTPWPTPKRPRPGSSRSSQGIPPLGPGSALTGNGTTRFPKSGLIIRTTQPIRSRRPWPCSILSAEPLWRRC